MIEGSGGGLIDRHSHLLAGRYCGVATGNGDFLNDIDVGSQVRDGDNAGGVGCDRLHQLAVLVVDFKHGARDAGMRVLSQSLQNDAGNAVVDEFHLSHGICSDLSPLIGLVEQIPLGSRHLMHHVGAGRQLGSDGSTGSIGGDLSLEGAALLLDLELRTSQALALILSISQLDNDGGMCDLLELDGSSLVLSHSHSALPLHDGITVLHSDFLNGVLAGVQITGSQQAGGIGGAVEYFLAGGILNSEGAAVQTELGTLDGTLNDDAAHLRAVELGQIDLVPCHGDGLRRGIQQIPVCSFDLLHIVDAGRQRLGNSFAVLVSCEVGLVIAVGGNDLIHSTGDCGAGLVVHGLHLDGAQRHMDEPHISGFTGVQNDVGLCGVDQVIPGRDSSFRHHVVAGNQLISAGHTAFIGDELCHFLTSQSVVDDVRHVGDGVASLIVRIHDDGALLGVCEGGLGGLVVLNSHRASSGVRHIPVGSEHFLDAVLAGLQDLRGSSAVNTGGDGLDFSAQRIADDEHRARQGFCSLGVQLLDHDSAVLLSGQNCGAGLGGRYLNRSAVDFDGETVRYANELCGVGARIQIFEGDSAIFGSRSGSDLHALLIDQRHTAAGNRGIRAVDGRGDSHEGASSVVEVSGSDDASLDLNGLGGIHHHITGGNSGLSDDVSAILQGSDSHGTVSLSCVGANHSAIHLGDLVASTGQCFHGICRIITGDTDGALLRSSEGHALRYAAGHRDCHAGHVHDVAGRSLCNDAVVTAGDLQEVDLTIDVGCGRALHDFVIGIIQGERHAGQRRRCCGVACVGSNVAVRGVVECLNDIVNLVRDLDSGGLHLIDVAVGHSLLRNDVSTVGQVAQIDEACTIGRQIRSCCGGIVAVGFLDFPSSAGDALTSDSVTDDNGDRSGLAAIERLDVRPLPCFDGHLLRSGGQLIVIRCLRLSNEISAIGQVRDGQAAIRSGDTGSDGRAVRVRYLELGTRQCLEVRVCVGVIAIDVERRLCIVRNLHLTVRIDRCVQPQRLHSGVELVVVRRGNLCDAVLTGRKSCPADLPVGTSLLDFIDLLTACCDVFQLNSGVGQSRL